jgi:hypothetical protein
MNHRFDDNKEAYREKLYERIGPTPTYKTVLGEYGGSSELLLEHFINGNLTLNGESVCSILCKERFEQEPSLNLSNNNETDE